MFYIIVTGEYDCSLIVYTLEDLRHHIHVIGMSLKGTKTFI